ncbi:MAG: GTP 3',8-cyclase 1 [Myxococcales bacterium]
MPLADTLRRPLRSLRLSVTDRCNLRCAYCMPEHEYVWLPREDILRFEEMVRLVGVFASLGVDKVRLTGGEPLLRRDVDRLVGMLAAHPSIEDLALTTNGVLLGGRAQALKDAGLHRITVSLDTLRPDRFARIARFDLHAQVLAGIEAAATLWPGRLKLDAVIERGVNDDELAPLVRFAAGLGAEVRFIEYMDVGGATRWSPERVVSRREMLARVGAELGSPVPTTKDGWAPADRFALPDGTTFGVISSTTEPFCGTCDRSRLTADGTWLLCLYAHGGTDLRGPLRAGATDDDLRALITGGWGARADRGAEQRRDAEARGALATAEVLRDSPHLEMHTRGG